MRPQKKKAKKDKDVGSTSWRGDVGLQPTPYSLNTDVVLKEKYTDKLFILRYA
jgi:hypothetical protein